MALSIVQHELPKCASSLNKCDFPKFGLYRGGLTWLLALEIGMDKPLQNKTKDKMKKLFLHTEQAV